MNFLKAGSKRTKAATESERSKNEMRSCGIKITLGAMNGGNAATRRHATVRHRLGGSFEFRQPGLCVLGNSMGGGIVTVR